ncbi:prephenate/arogenate dehydrogenase family protein [Mesorhizobium hawassense]|uniref:prephenate dehydrogenase n=1 Tax=Mesorhizobium hawassense TaxID=1209954 RepID=A0A330H8S7_9HYPH|nr:prephenate/arogenate dehydrogenase family protein [Mesorhizobium hawassense]
MFGKIGLVGIGPIGSSLARVICRERLAGHIAIASGGIETLKRAEKLKLGDTYTTEANEAVRGADLVVVSVPVGASGAVAEEIEPALKEGAILTEVGSAKVSAIAQMQPVVPEGVHFIPGHPLTGTEKSGDAGFADLFENRWCILTPLEGTDLTALEKLSEFWRRCGANIGTTDPQHHDTTLALVSHLPHIIAYNIVGTAADLETVTKSKVIKYSASGFRDLTRLAASDPRTWHDMCLHNRDAILEMMARFLEDLAHLQRAIRWGEGDKLFDFFTRARAIRCSIIEEGQNIDASGYIPSARQSGIRRSLAQQTAPSPRHPQGRCQLDPSL